MALKSGMSPSAPDLKLLLPYAISRGQPVPWEIKGGLHEGMYLFTTRSKAVSFHDFPLPATSFISFRLLCIQILTLVWAVVCVLGPLQGSSRILFFGIKY